MNLRPDFEQRWRAARARNDTETLGELALSTEQGAPVPPWLKQEAWEVMGEIASWLGRNLDRQDDSRVGVNLIHISALIDTGTAIPYTLAGLAYECWQPRIKNNPLDDEITGLLDSQLELLGMLPEARWEKFMSVVREVCLIRVVDLLRADFARRFEPLLRDYHGALEILRNEQDYRQAKESLEFVNERVNEIVSSHRRMAKYLPVLMKEENRAHVKRSLDYLESLAAAGRSAADCQNY